MIPEPRAPNREPRKRPHHSVSVPQEIFDAAPPTLCRCCHRSAGPARRGLRLRYGDRSLPRRRVGRVAENLRSPAGGRVEIRNVNGRIEVQPSSGHTVEVVAVKTARGPDRRSRARGARRRSRSLENVGADVIRVETKLPRGAGFFSNGGEVRYTVKVPASAVTEVITVNGGVEVIGLTGRIRAETTNGGIVGRDVSGSLEASTTNGGDRRRPGARGGGGRQAWSAPTAASRCGCPATRGRPSRRASPTAASIRAGCRSKRRTRAAAASRRG